MFKVHCFMLATRALSAEASVAAITIRKRHPTWIFWLVTTDGLVAPWRDTTHAAFDNVIGLQALAVHTAGVTGNDCKHGRGVRRIGSAFRAIFEHGADLAVLVNPHHVWFANLPVDTVLSGAAQFVCFFDDFVPLQSDVCGSVALLGLERGADIEQVVAQAAINARSNPVPPRTPSGVIGLSACGMQRHPARFDVDGQLRWGSHTVRSVNFSNLPMSEAERSVVDTTWLELRRWYRQELSRFGSYVPDKTSK